jgi:hypothetical protein
VFNGEKAVIKVVWASSYTLKSDECYLVSVSWSRQGSIQGTETCVQSTSWFVDAWLYLQADQESGRLYHWTVRIARRGNDAQGNNIFIPLSPSSEARTFSWK